MQHKLEFFKTPIWVEERKEYLKSLLQHSNKYITEAKKTKEAKEWRKKVGDFGRSYHSTPLTIDNNFLDFRNYVGEKCWQFLDESGFDMSRYKLMFTEMWVQEFAKNGGGHHSSHVHWNQHVSGFYFLKCSKKTSFPIFHEPRTGARATKLHLKTNDILPGTELVHFVPTPGKLILFPGYMEHEFAVDHGKDPFRFIHFNLQAIPKEAAKTND